MPVKRVPSPELANVKALVEGLAGVETKVGWFEGNKYPTKSGEAVSVAYVAAVQEFGYPEGGIPSRSYFRTTISERQAEWSKIIAAGARKAIAGKATPFQALDTVGQIAAGDVRKAIAQLTTPALAPATIAARKRRGNSNTKPLSDTRVMMETLTHVTSQGNS